MPGGDVGNDCLYASNGFGYSLPRAGYTDIVVLPFACRATEAVEDVTLLVYEALRY